MKEDILCIFGASSTWGAWDLEKGGWVNRLRLYIDQTVNQGDEHYIETYNLGISGHTTRELVKRFKNEAEIREATMIILSSADNDACCFMNDKRNMVPIEESEENLRTILAQAKEITDKVLVIGMKRVDESKTLPVPWREELGYRNADLERYDEMFMRVTEDVDVAYLSAADMLTDNDLADGLHPNEQGHEKSFIAVRDWLKEHGWI